MSTEKGQSKVYNIRKSVAGGSQISKHADEPLLYPKGRNISTKKNESRDEISEFCSPC